MHPAASTAKRNMAAIVKLATLVCIVSATWANPTIKQRSTNTIQTENTLLDNIYKDCLKKDSISCAKFKLLTLVDEILINKESITVVDGVQIVKTEAGEPEGAPRSLNEPDTFEGLIFNRMSRFLNTHTLKININGKDLVETARSISSDDAEEFTEEGRQQKRKKMKKGMGMMMMLAGLKMAMMGKMALAGIAMMAGKALMIGKMALVLSAIIGLKKLFGGQGKHVTYEVVSHGGGDSHGHGGGGGGGHGGIGGGGGYGGGDVGGGGGGYGSSGHGGWGRSIEAQKLAYNAQIPQEEAKY